MGTRQRFPLYEAKPIEFLGGVSGQCPEQARLEVQIFVRTNAVLAERLCEAKYSELYPPEGALPTSEDLYLDSEKGMMVLSSGRCAPCSLASSIEDSTSRPSELRKRTLVLVLGQVVLTEPLRFRLGHPMDHSNAADSSLVASLPEMRTAHALACPLMGYVCRFVAMCS